MKRFTIIMATLALAGTVAVIWQRQSLATVAGAEQGFRASGAVPTDNNLEAETLHDLREQTKELARLRNEVSRLRGLRTDLAAARAESVRLQQARRTEGQAFPSPPGFTSRQQLANVGFATPEASLQTFFWAMKEGDLEMTMRAMSPDSADRKSFDQLPPDQRLAAQAEFKRDVGERSMIHFNDVGIRQREDLSDSSVVLHYGSSVSTNTMRLLLQRVGGEWKIQEFP